MGAALYGRRVRFTVSLPGDLTAASAALAQGGGIPAVVVEDLRVGFKIKKTPQKHPNEAEITIYNLNADRRAGMTAQGSRVIVEAGYTATFGPIFGGDAHAVDHDHVGPDWVTKIKALDSGRAFQHARISESWSGVVRAGDIVARCVDELGIGRGNLSTITPQLNARAAYDHGYVAFGQASKELDSVLRAAGFEWSIQDGELQIVETDGVTGAVEVLSPSTGLVGSPETASGEHRKGPVALKVRCLLRWGLTPGGVVVLEDTAKAGRYRILKVEQEGDTHATEWYSDLEVTPL